MCIFFNCHKKNHNKSWINGDKNDDDGIDTTIQRLDLNEICKPNNKIIVWMNAFRSLYAFEYAFPEIMLIMISCHLVERGNICELSIIIFGYEIIKTWCVLGILFHIFVRYIFCIVLYKQKISAGWKHSVR